MHKLFTYPVTSFPHLAFTSALRKLFSSLGLFRHEPPLLARSRNKSFLAPNSEASASVHWTHGRAANITMESKTSQHGVQCSTSASVTDSLSPRLAYYHTLQRKSSSLSFMHVLGFVLLHMSLFLRWFPPAFFHSLLTHPLKVNFDTGFFFLTSTASGEQALCSPYNNCHSVFCFAYLPFASAITLQ